MSKKDVFLWLTCIAVHTHVMFGMEPKHSGAFSFTLELYNLEKQSDENEPMKYKAQSQSPSKRDSASTLVRMNAPRGETKFYTPQGVELEPKKLLLKRRASQSETPATQSEVQRFLDPVARELAKNIIIDFECAPDMKVKTRLEATSFSGEKVYGKFTIEFSKKQLPGRIQRYFMKKKKEKS